MPGVFAAVTCDIMSSRKLAHRQEIQDLIKSAIEKVNSAWAEAIASPFLITLGDEWQGLLRRPELSYQVVGSFQRILKDIEFYAGIGIGEISTEIAPVSEMDGPAFHRARAALEKAKLSRSPVVFSIGDPQEDDCLNAFTALIEGIKGRRTHRQAQVIELYEGLKSMEGVGARLGISKQAVSKVLKAAMWDQIRDALGQVEFLIGLFTTHNAQRGPSL